MKKNKLQNLEEKVKQWLEEDKQYLLERARDVLWIQTSISTDANKDKEAIDPIHKLVGIKYKESRNLEEENKIIETDRDRYLFPNQKLRLLIEEKDFRIGKGVDGKERTGIYEFTSIFFSRDFLAYYKCYWNFIKNLSVEEEVCEILYNNIVSVKLKERSSTKSKDIRYKRIYRNFLSITTTDGKIFSFRIDKDRKEKSGSTLRESQVEEAGRIIRYKLRQNAKDISKKVKPSQGQDLLP